jgi:hypothetical protein
VRQLRRCLIDLLGLQLPHFAADPEEQCKTGHERDAEQRGELRPKTDVGKN